MTLRTVTIMAVAATAMLAPTTAHAQKLLLGGSVAYAGGVEGGDGGLGVTAFRRARSRVVVAVDGRIDEDPDQGLQVVGWVEVEPMATVGGELRYLRWLNPRIAGFVGGTVAIAPHNLLGGDVGLQFYFPSRDNFGVFVEPSFAAVPFGSDLPSDRMLLWGLISIGLHAKL
jgi:hypothetical protein